MSTTSTSPTSSTGTSTTTTASSTASAKWQHAGLIVELCGAAAFLAGCVLSAHHYAIGACFLGGAAAFFVGRRLRKG